MDSIISELDRQKEEITREQLNKLYFEYVESNTPLVVLNQLADIQIKKLVAISLYELLAVKRRRNKSRTRRQLTRVLNIGLRTTYNWIPKIKEEE